MSDPSNEATLNNAEPLSKGETYLALTHKQCPLCLNIILLTAVKCKHCKAWLDHRNEMKPTWRFKSMVNPVQTKFYSTSLIVIGSFFFLLDSMLLVPVLRANFAYGIGFLLARMLDNIMGYGLIVIFVWLVVRTAKLPFNSVMQSKTRGFMGILLVILLYLQSYDMVQKLKTLDLKLLTSNSNASLQKSLAPPSVLGETSTDGEYESIVIDYDGSPVRIPMGVVGTSHVIDAYIMGAKPYYGQFMVDTGAEVTVLYQKFFERHHLKLPQGCQKVNLFGFTGNASVPLIYVTLEIGDVKIENVMVVVTQDDPNHPSLDGVIGTNVLKNFNVTFNQEEMLFILNE